jgi:glycosyltransferase involved in cell wall biosynthesis
LLRFLEWAAREQAVTPFFLHRRSGELMPEFRRLGPGWMVPAAVERGAHRALAGHPGAVAAFDRTARVGLRSIVRTLCRHHQIDIVYANTLTHAFALTALGDLDVPIVCHVHELDRLAEQLTRPADLGVALGLCDGFLAVSDAVRGMLIRRGVDTGAIHLVSGTVPELAPLGDDERNRIRRQVFATGDRTTLVVACGRPGWVKGPDVFLQVARSALARAHPGTPLQFAWLGGSPDHHDTAVLQTDTDRMGLSDRVRIIPPIPDANVALGAADIMLSPSREDANPLAVLEAAMQARPIVCFRGAGGVDDLACSGGAIAVPYLDADAMADAIICLNGDPDRRAAIGAAAREFAIANATIERVGPRAVAALRALAGVGAA